MIVSECSIFCILVSLYTWKNIFPLLRFQWKKGLTFFCIFLFCCHTQKSLYKNRFRVFFAKKWSKKCIIYALKNINQLHLNNISIVIITYTYFTVYTLLTWGCTAFSFFFSFFSFSPDQSTGFTAPALLPACRGATPPP